MSRDYLNPSDDARWIAEAIEGLNETVEEATAEIARLTAALADLKAHPRCKCEPKEMTQAEKYKASRLQLLAQQGGIYAPPPPPVNAVGGPQTATPRGVSR